MHPVEKIAAYLQENAGPFLVRLATAALIAIVGLVVGKVVSRLTATAVSKRKGNRILTLAPIVKTLVFVAIFGTAIVMSLDHLGLDVATLLAGAGIVGLAIGFGAQTLVKDCLSGFFLILDDVIARGDIVTIKDASDGVVENVGLRVTSVRSFNGQLWYIPNGSITTVGNWNRGWVRAVVELGISYSADIRTALTVLKRVGDAWAAEHTEWILEPPSAEGLLGFNESDVSVRLVVKIKNDENQLWQSERELRRRVKEAFDEAEIEIPFPQRVVYHHHVTDGSVPNEETEARSSGDAVV